MLTAWDLHCAKLEALLRLARALTVQLGDVDASTRSGRVAIEKRVLVAIQLEAIRGRAARRKAA